MKEADIIDALKLSVEQTQTEVLLPIGDDGSVIKLGSKKQEDNSIPLDQIITLDDLTNPNKK